MKTSLLLLLFSFPLYAGSGPALWQYGHIKSWNKDHVKVSLVTNTSVEISQKLFKDLEVSENIPIRITYKNKAIYKVEKIRYEEKLDLEIISENNMR